MLHPIRTAHNFFDFKPNNRPNDSAQKPKNTAKKQEEKIDKTLKGVLLNTYIKDKAKESDIDEICNSLIIPDNFKAHPALKNAPIEEIENQKSKKRSLVRNVLPYAASALLATGMALAVSHSYLKSQKLLKPGNVPTGAKLPVVGKNINLRTEEYFAIYMAISEPKSKNILALLGILTMSTLTFVGKTFVDGTKKVWLKKQEADVKKRYEDNVIDIETQAFAGKLDVVREELIKKTKYFKEKLKAAPSKEETSTINSEGKILNSDLHPIFGKFINFTGNKPEMPLSSINMKLLREKSAKADNSSNKDETSFKGKVKEFIDNFKDSPAGLIAVSALTLGLVALGGRKIFKNISEGAKIKEDALNKSREKIRESIKEAVEEFKTTSDGTKKDEILQKIKEKLLSVGADTDEIKETFQKTGLKTEAVQNLTDEVGDAVSKMKFGEKFYVQADPAMGGKEGTQFYIYIDQAKGYIYDVITHPENKFARYLFTAITATGATGYVAKESIDAIKEAAIIKENSNTELELQRRLVNTEIRKFRAKKQSAIEPLMIEFDTKLKEGKSSEELKVMAENILLEIKNGPPFVYE